MGFDITSASNDRLKRLVRLHDRRHRDREGVFVVEGPRLVGRAQAAGYVPIEVYVDRSIPFEWPTSTLTVEPSILNRVSYREQSEGVIAVFEQFDTSLETIDLGVNPLVLVAEGIEKPGNLGAMLRLADAVGADGLVSVAGVIDLFNPNVLRSSTGALFSVPVAACDLDQAIAWIRSGPTRLIAAVPGTRTVLWDLDLTGPTCLMVGAEDLGLTLGALMAADEQFSIPMAGTTDSLNTSMALSVSAFEAVRQRRLHSR